MKWRLLTLLLLLELSSLFVIPKVFAADAIPPGGRIPCPVNPPANPEFSSDRPYQASPCGSRPITYWCGNGVVIDLGSVSTDYCGADTCPANIHKDQRVVVDLTNVQMPILGNTQITANSQNATDQIDDATKVNDYLSWYLAGTNDKAETATDNLDTAGPIKKLLPGVIQDATRIATIKSTSDKSATYTDEETGNEVTGEATNHNQIVACADKGYVLGPIGWLFGLVNKATPKACYAGGGGKAKETTYRLEDWSKGDLGGRRTITNAIIDLIKNIPGINDTIVGQSLDTAWNKRYPPLPWSDENGKPFKDSISYQKAYNEWRGDTCIVIPVINKLFCFANPAWASPEWSDLFPYVPLANTVDKKGAQAVTNVHISAPRATIEIPIENGAEHGYDINHSPQLYIGHSLENNDLTTLLQSTFKPQVKTGTSKEAPAVIPGDVENSTTCQIVNSRTNEGDDATFDNPKSYIDVTVHYDVTEIECHDPREVCDRDPDTHVCLPTTHTVANCSSEVYASISSISKTPYADEIWSNTVAGSQSIFRRIYPKTGTNAPVSCIADAPAASNATYTLSDGTDKSVSGIQRIIEPDNTSIGAGGSAQSADAQVYFPHVGGVLEYFLNGIQTALRPQGLDQQPVNGQYCSPKVPNECKVDIPDSAVPSKFLGSFKSNFIDLANRWSDKCAGPSFNLASQCYNYVVSEAQKAKVNPAFVLTIWLNESGASNYCASGKTAQDFGVNLPSIYQNIVGQLKEFLKLPDRFSYCRSTAGWIEPMEAFLSRFQSHDGACNPADTVAAQYYADVRDNTWQFVTGTKCIKNGKFSITWPTDMSCP